MRIFKVTLLIFTCLVFNSLNGQNPFSSLGVKDSEVKMLSLTKGKYQEIIPNDTLVKVGSVIVNTITDKVEYFVEKDTLYSESTLEPEVVSKWMSPDPIFTPYESPYAAMANNPILYKDPDGRHPVVAIWLIYEGIVLLVTVTAGTIIVQQNPEMFAPPASIPTLSFDDLDIPYDQLRAGTLEKPFEGSYLKEKPEDEFPEFNGGKGIIGLVLVATAASGLKDYFDRIDEAKKSLQKPGLTEKDKKNVTAEVTGYTGGKRPVSTNEDGTVNVNANININFNYKIQQNDNLTNIAERFGTTVDTLMELNNIDPKNKDTIKAGDSLIVGQETVVPPVQVGP
ncbi:MAG: LysM peptidoglycan-binding domain-containing protein [Cytophagaceae bacterium]|nr:LysM peptidoglycan-binding domain-containing protein [Cytophagaceae bacterium]